MIADYGQMERMEFGVMSITMDNEIDWRRIEGLHLRPTGKTEMMANGRLFQAYIVMRGSHTYDTKEMSTLIDGTIYEAKELDIETITSNQMAEMMAKWDQKVSSKNRDAVSSAETNETSRGITASKDRQTESSPKKTACGSTYVPTVTEEPMVSTE